MPVREINQKQALVLAKSGVTVRIAVRKSAQMDPFPDNFDDLLDSCRFFIGEGLLPTERKKGGQTKKNKETSKQSSSRSADKKQPEKKKQNTRITWDALEDDELLRIRRAGMTIDDIAREFNAAQFAVISRLDQLEKGNLTASGKKVDGPKIRALWKAGWEIKDIAADTDCSEEIVRRELSYINA